MLDHGICRISFWFVYYLSPSFSANNNIRFLDWKERWSLLCFFSNLVLSSGVLFNIMYSIIEYILNETSKIKQCWMRKKCWIFKWPLLQLCPASRTVSVLPNAGAGKSQGSFRNHGLFSPTSFAYRRSLNYGSSSSLMIRKFFPREAFWSFFLCIMLELKISVLREFIVKFEIMRRAEWKKILFGIRVFWNLSKNR